MVERLRDRVASVVDEGHEGYSNSSFVGIDPQAYDVWKSHDCWVVPWLQEAGEKEAVVGGGSFGGTTHSGGGGGVDT